MLPSFHSPPPPSETDEVGSEPERLVCIPARHLTPRNLLAVDVGLCWLWNRRVTDPMEMEKPHDVGGCKTTCGAFWNAGMEPSSKIFDAECNLSTPQSIPRHAGEGKRKVSFWQRYPQRRLA